MAAEPDVFVYAHKRVTNKGVGARIAHSPALHPYRSVFSSGGSAVSKGVKLLGVAGRGAMKLIPIPAVGSLAASLENYAEGRLRKWQHGKKFRAARAAGDLQAQVKFELKDLSLDELDRYRAKVKFAMDDLNKKVQDHDKDLATNRALGKECQAYVDLAIAVEQALRRIWKLSDKCGAVIAVMEETQEWLNQLENGEKALQKEGVIGTAVRISDELQDKIQAYQKLHPEDKKSVIASQHPNCTEWCWAQDVDKPVSAPWTVTDWTAKVLRCVTEAASLDDVAGAGGDIGRAGLDGKL